MLLFAGISEDAEVGDFIGGFSTNFDKAFKKYLYYSIDKVTSTFKNGTTLSLPINFFTLSISDIGITVYLNSLVDKYINSFITTQLRASVPNSSVMNETATTSFNVNYVFNGHTCSNCIM